MGPKEEETLAEWERELLGYSNDYSIPRTFITGGGASVKCGDLSCTMCFPPANNCSGCKQRDERIKEQSAALRKQDAKVIDLTERLAKVQEERDAFNLEAENLAEEHDALVEFRDTLLEHLAWTEEELTKAWLDLEEANGRRAA